MTLLNLQEVGHCFLCYNKSLQELNFPNLEIDKIGFKFLKSHPIFNKDNFNDNKIRSSKIKNLFKRVYR